MADERIFQARGKLRQMAKANLLRMACRDYLSLPVMVTAKEIVGP